MIKHLLWQDSPHYHAQRNLFLIPEDQHYLLHPDGAWDWTPDSRADPYEASTLENAGGEEPNPGGGLNPPPWLLPNPGGGAPPKPLPAGLAGLITPLGWNPCGIWAVGTDPKPGGGAPLCLCTNSVGKLAPVRGGECRGVTNGVASGVARGVASGVAIGVARGVDAGVVVLLQERWDLEGGSHVADRPRDRSTFLDGSATISKNW